MLLLRGRWLYVAVGIFFGFHFATYLSLGIHFLQTIVCWSSFLALEKFPLRLNRKFSWVTAYAEQSTERATTA